MDVLEDVRSNIRICDLKRSIQEGHAVSNSSFSKKFTRDFVKFLELIVEEMKEGCMDYAVTISKRNM